MNSEFQSLPPETQEAVKRTMDTIEPAQTPAEIRETLEGTQKGGVKNSIRNCLTVFQRDPLFRGALRLNLLTEQIDIVKPLGWERTSTTLTDMDMNYLLLYLEAACNGTAQSASVTPCITFWEPIRTNTLMKP